MNRLRTLRYLGLATIVVLALGASAACGDDDANTASGGLQKVTLMLDWTPNTNHSGIYIARDKGWYKEAGIDLQIVEPAQSGVEQAVATGAAQFGISIQENVIPAREQSLPIVSIAAIIQHNTSSLMSLANENLKRPKDLSGKTYGAFGGPIEEPLIKQLVKCDGGDPDSIKFVNIGNSDYLVGMGQNQYDFVWVFDGWDAIRARDIEKTSVNTIPFIDYTKCIPDWYTPLIITSEKMASSQKDLVSKFMAATSRGYQDAISNPQDAVDALMKAAPENDKQLVTLSAQYLAKRYSDAGRQWGLQDANIWTGFEKFLKDNAIIQKDVDVTKAYTNDFLPRSSGTK